MTQAETSSPDSSSGFVLASDQGDPYYWLGSLSINKVLGRSTLGGLDIVDHRVPPGYAPPLHVHREQDEVFFVLAGQFTVTAATGPGPPDPARWRSCRATFRTDSPSRTTGPAGPCC